LLLLLLLLPLEFLEQLFRRFGSLLLPWVLLVR
jgi:hypothetical protein